MGILTRLVEVADRHNYTPEFYPDGTEKHVFLNGARFHVLSYGASGARCSVAKCEYNLPDKQRIALMVDSLSPSVLSPAVPATPGGGLSTDGVAIPFKEQP